jgi:hypothetical protein
LDEAALAAAQAHRWLGRPPALQGESRRPLAGVDFYRAVGRDDLADQYRMNLVLRWTLIGLGISGNVLGLVAVAIGPALFAPAHRNTTGAAGGQILPLLLCGFGGSAGAVLGTGLWAGGVLLDPHPIDLPATRELIDEYNKRLLGELSLDE